MWLTFFILSVSCLVFTVAFSLLINKRKVVNKKNFNIFYLLFTGVFAAAFFMFLPIHIVTADVSVLGCIRAILLSIFNSIKVFSFGCQFGNVTQSMGHCPGEINLVYQVWVSLMFLIAPAFTISFVLSVFKNISAYIKYFCSYNKDVYVFSELNEKSLVLASDIKNKHKDVAIVFTDVFEENKESTYELIEKAKNIRAICFKKDILVVNFKKHSTKKSIFFFTIGNDETENLNQSLKLIDCYKNIKNTHIYVFSVKTESELLLSSIDKGEIKVRRINEVKSLINRVLYEQGDILFDTAGENVGGNKQISAVVIGMGSHGTEMVKALTWFCQMDGYRLQIDAFDKDPLAYEKLTFLAPELMSPDYNGVDIKGEAQYKIIVHSGIDIETISFVDEIKKLNNASYVFVALGNDDMNIKTATNLRMYFERMKIHPFIHAVLYNSQQKKALEGIANYRGQSYDISFVGDIESSFTEDVIIDSELEEEALKRHLKWGVEDDFWKYEYNYRSSMASAIHMQARVKCAIPGSSKKTEELTDEERNIIEVLEHRRWNAYMRSEGYIYSGSKDKSSRNDLGKMHHDLVDFSSLSEEDKRKDSMVGTN